MLMTDSSSATPKIQPMAASFRFSVCPHDTAKNLAGWFLLNTYLQRKLGFGMHFEPADNFNVEREAVLAGGADFVYANPFSAFQYHRQRGFVPVAKPVALCDETLLVARAGEAPDPSQGLTIASATDKLIVHFLGLTILDELGWPPERMRYEYVGNHLKAAQAVITGKADAGFVFNETWQGMAATSRASLQVLGETRRRLACHCFCVGPALQDRVSDIQAILFDMHRDPAGKRVLDDLRFSGFEPIEADSMARLGALVAEAGEACV